MHSVLWNLNLLMSYDEIKYKQFQLNQNHPNTVGIWNLTIWNLETFEIPTFEGWIPNGPVFKWWGFRYGYNYCYTIIQCKIELYVFIQNTSHKTQVHVELNSILLH